MTTVVLRIAKLMCNTFTQKLLPLQ